MRSRSSTQARTTLYGSALLVFFTCGFGVASAQIPIVASEVTIIDFYDLGTSPGATLPQSARVATYSEARAVGPFNAASNKTQYTGGNGVDASVPSGIYNFGSGNPATAPDRAVGFVLGNDGVKSGALYLHFVNKTNKPLSRLTFGASTEIYRQGTGPENTGGVSEVISLFSSDGQTFVPWGGNSGGGMSYSTQGFDDAPRGGGSSFGNAVAPLEVIPPGGTFYIGFRYSVTEGDDVQNMPAFAIDDVVIGPDDADFSFMTPSRLQREFGEIPVGETSPTKQLGLVWTANILEENEPDPPAMTVTGEHAGDFSVTQTYGASNVLLHFYGYESASSRRLQAPERRP